jgi:amino acid adenylation domain-containing protein
MAHLFGASITGNQPICFQFACAHGFRHLLEKDTEQTIPQLFSRQVSRFPNLPAIKTTTHVISYSELDRLSNQVANAILHQSYKTSDTIALLFEQGADSVISILGVLKAGKIYVSLDPSSRKEDLRRFIEDSDPAVLILAEKHRCLGQELQSSSLDILAIETIDSFSAELPEPKTMSPDSPAYIFYTSGSTGMPKGVVDSHRNVLHNVLRYTNALNLDYRDHLSMIQACSFSGTVSSLFSALLNGGAVCPFNLTGAGIEALADFIIETQVSVFHSVPTIFEHLMLAGRNFPNVRIVRLEGDRTDPRHIQLFDRNFSGNCQLAIGLGATETGLTRQYVHSPNDTYPQSVSPLGYAVEGMEISLVDDSGIEVRPGEPGEIVVQSQYLAQGYWRKANLTAITFVPEPRNSSTRRYRTGDIGRMLPDHCLLYLGRMDYRVKIQGISIESSQVESALESHPLIEHALVQSVETRRGVQQLVAYLVIRDSSALKVCQIRRFASRHLPIHMIPSRYEFLDVLPTDRHGKISRGRLPPIQRVRPPLQQLYEPPKTDRQLFLTQCFEDILCVDKVGMLDNFYDLGGDSLLVMQLLLVVEEKTGLTFPEREFFESPNIKTIDCFFEKKPADAFLISLQSQGSRSPLICLHNQLGTVIHYRALAELLAPDIPVIGVRAATISRHVTATSIESLAAEYLPLLRERQKSGPYFLCGNCFDGLLAFEVAQQLIKQGQVVEFLGLIDTEFPMGTLQAGARRVVLSKNPVHAIGLVFWRKFLHIFTLISDLWSRITDSNSQSQNREQSRDYCSEKDHIVELRDNRISKLMDKAAAEYRPKTYSGEVTLFYTGTIGNRYGWHRVAAGGYSTVELADMADGHSPHLVARPFVEDLAVEIKRILE